MTVTQYIPAAKFSLFHEILCATGGRYLRNPVWVGLYLIEVHYEPGDYDEQCKRWNQFRMPIRETKREQWWRKILRRCGLRF